MQSFPHDYTVEAMAAPEGDVSLAGEGLDGIPSAPPPEFGGPGDRWSPETLLVASVADCFILSFRAISRASKLAWISLECSVEGTLDRHEGTTKFTHFLVNATLRVPPATDESRARRILQKAEESCLITNSLSGSTHLEATILETPET